MTSNALPNCFITGCQKTASTWLYHCFKEHPDVFVPEIDRINYFSFQHYRGRQWLENWYKNVGNEKAICDPTPSYFQAPGAAERIALHNPDSRILIALRHPVERSFSHYKHLFRKEQISVSFENALEKASVGSFDFFRLLIHPSLYADKLKAFYDVFPKEQVLVSLYEDLSADPEAYLKRIFRFLEVDDAFIPDSLHKKINVAGQKKDKVNLSQKNIVEKLKSGDFLASAQRVLSNQLTSHENKRQAPAEMSEGMKHELNQLFKEDIEKTADLINRDLSHWTVS